MIQSHRFNGFDITGEISVTTSLAVGAILALTGFTPFRLTVFLEFTVLTEELLEEESEEQELSTEALLCTTDVDSGRLEFSVFVTFLELPFFSLTRRKP